MSIRISWILGAVVALAPLAQAVAFTTPGAQTRTETLAQSVSMHHHMHHARHHHHHHHHGMMSRGAGRCGENMYYSRKAGHCLDARDKT